MSDNANELLRAKVVTCFGEAQAKYLDNKHRGGANGAKGGKFELFFSVHRIARLSQKLINNELDSYIEQQSYCFVDDLVVTVDSTKTYKGYQLKNSSSVKWSGGEHPIETDFTMQEQLSTFTGFEIVKLRLVCSSNEVVGELNEEIPESISRFSKAIYFPFDEQLSRIFQSEQWMYDDFRFLAHKENCTANECADIAKVLIGAWSAMNGKLKVSEVIGAARKCSPSIIRSLRSDDEAAATLRLVCRSILDQIDGFEYVIQRGFLVWNAHICATSGVLSFDCFDDKFMKFQDAIEHHQPRSFEDLEGFLT